jgi:hypothetical protein
MTFPALWAHMTNLREIYGRKKMKKMCIKTVQARRRQVFMSLLFFKRMQNPKSLTHWALILSISYKSMGVGSTALDITNYFGIVVSSTKRDAYINKLYAGIQARQTEMFLKENFIIYVIDDFQRGQRLKKQRGGHSSSFLRGTNQFAQLPQMSNQSQFKGFIPITKLLFDMKQPIISPFGMPAYEDKIDMDNAAFFNEHSSFSSAPDIDTISCARVKAYADRGDVCQQILAISRVVGTTTDVKAGKFIKKFTYGYPIE